jgi:hypothetical protein
LVVTVCDAAASENRVALKECAFMAYEQIAFHGLFFQLFLRRLIVDINIENILMLTSLTLNLIGVMLTVSSKIRSNNYQIDGGDFSGNSGFIKIRLGWSYKLGWLTLCVGVCLQIIIISCKIIGG